MKHLFTLLLAALAFVATAQPQKINYQGVAVGANGKPMKNSTVGLRLSVLDSLPTGNTLYTETQAASTDAAGQFSIYLGGGTATVGTFANLPWANGNDKFLKVEMDAQGGSNYHPMGTTQLVSVPYAMAAGSLKEGALLYGNNGQTYSLTIGANGPTWTCYPPVTAANAGADQLNICASSVILAGNTPSNGTAAWSIISGAGGSLGTPNSANTTFTGTRGNSYSLRYSISNACGSSADTVAVNLAPTTTIANAGPDQLSLTGTTATLAANALAAGETGAWSMVAGSGGSLSSNNNPSAMFTKGTDSSYTLVWTITGPCGNSQDTVNLSFQNLVMNIPCPGISSVNYAGESYPTVQIGTQCWFAKNLNVGTMVLGANDQTNNSTLEKYCYNNDPANCATYGGLYQWAEAVQYQNGASNTTSPSPAFTGNVRGICPTGWHLPSDGEWSSLQTTLGGSSVAGGALKSTSGLWISPNAGATNSSGFSALPGGYRDINGSFYAIGINTVFWSSSRSSSATAVTLGLVYDSSRINRGSEDKGGGFSARCTQD